MNNKKIFEKIITEKRAKSSNERPKYGLRKLTVGVVSCLLGYMMFMTPNVVAAEKVDAPAAVEQPAEQFEAESSKATTTNAQDRAVRAPEVSTEVAAASDKEADKFTAELKAITVKVGEVVDYTKAVTNLPEGAKVIADVDTNEVGEKKVQATIKFSDGSTKTVEITVNVKAEEKLEVSADGADKKDAQSAPAPGTEDKNKDLEEKGDKQRDKAEPKVNALDFGLKKDGSIEEKKAEEAIANKAELTDAKSYEWVKKPEFGDTEAHVKVTYKDGSYDIVTVAITTPKRPEEREGSNIITKGGNSFKDAIDASTDKTSKSKQTLAGFAWIENEPNFGSRDDGDIPAAGKKVYAQWKDGNGVVSPIFSTVVREDGSFVFDLSRPVKNADGSFTEFKLAGDPNFSVKMWAEEMEGYSIVKNGDMYSNYITRTYRTATA